MGYKSPSSKFDKLNADAYIEDIALIDSLRDQFGSRKEAIHFICEQFKKQPAPTDEMSSKTNGEKDLPSCSHRSQTYGKAGNELWCVFRRPCSPIQAKPLRLEWCKNCKMQEYNIPAKVMTETSKAETEEYENCETLIMQKCQPPKAVPLRLIDNYQTLAFTKQYEGSRICPIHSGYGSGIRYVTAQNCEQCRLSNSAKAEECLRLYFEVLRKANAIESLRLFDSKSDGSHLCYLDNNRQVYPLDCYKCRKDDPEKHEQCVTFHQSIKNPQITA